MTRLDPFVLPLVSCLACCSATQPAETLKLQTSSSALAVQPPAGVRFQARSVDEPEPVIVLPDGHVLSSTQQLTSTALPEAGGRRVLAKWSRPTSDAQTKVVGLEGGRIGLWSRSRGLRELGSFESVGVNDVGTWLYAYAGPRGTLFRLPSGEVAKADVTMAMDSELTRYVGDWILSDVGSHLPGFEPKIKPRGSVSQWAAGRGVAAALETRNATTAGSCEHWITTWNLDTGVQLESTRFGTACGGAELDVSPDGRYWVASHAGGLVQLFDLKTKVLKSLSTKTLADGCGTRVEFSSSGNEVCEVGCGITDVHEVVSRAAQPALVRLTQVEPCVIVDVPIDQGYHVPKVSGLAVARLAVDERRGFVAYLEEANTQPDATAPSRYRIRVVTKTGLAKLASFDFESAKGTSVSLSFNDVSGFLDTDLAGTYDVEKQRVVGGASLELGGMAALKPSSRVTLSWLNEHTLRVAGRPIEMGEPNLSDTREALESEKHTAIALSRGALARIYGVASGRRLATLVNGPHGTVALLSDGAVDVQGVVDDILFCRTGDVLLPWANCKGRFLVQGGLGQVFQAGKPLSERQ